MMIKKESSPEFISIDGLDSTKVNEYAKFIRVDLLKEIQQWIDEEDLRKVQDWINYKEMYDDNE